MASRAAKCVEFALCVCWRMACLMLILLVGSVWLFGWWLIAAGEVVTVASGRVIGWIDDFWGFL